MAKIFFIGTLHKGLTNYVDLESIILDINPDLLLLEISNKAIIENTIRDYPDEMLFALKLAKKNNIVHKGFDCKIDVVKRNITKEQKQVILDKQIKLIKKNKWQDFNKFKLIDKLNFISKNMFDKIKWDEREELMKKNIEKHLPKKGTVLILTGAGHLAFFRRHFPDALFPLSEY